MLDYTKPIYEFRITREVNKDILRYAEGTWIEDDGEYDLSFFDTKNRVLYCFRHFRLRHTWWASFSKKRISKKEAYHRMAQEGTTDFWGVWNYKKHPNFNIKHSFSTFKSIYIYMEINDKYVLGELVRDKKTKEILTPPDKFICSFCGYEK